MLRWGFLGAGGIARGAVGPAVHAAHGAVLHAAAARDPARARALGVERVHSSYADLLDDPTVDAVYISLSNEAHLPWTLAALEAGKHVLCEKPLALDAAEVEQIVVAARLADRMVVEASMWRWHPRTRRLAALLADQAIGSVSHVDAGFAFDGDLTGNYRAEPERGGGALYDVGCYTLSAVLVVLGSRPLADVRARASVGPTGIDLTTEAVLDFDPVGESATAATASIRASVAEPEAQWLVISGESGELECRKPVFTAWHSDTTELLVSDGRGTSVERFEPADPYRLMVEAFSARAEGDQAAWVLPLEQSLRIAQLLDQVRSVNR
jgi:predicted dehydrogenase